MIGWQYYKFIVFQFVLLVFVHVLFFALMAICIKVFSLDANLPVQEIHKFHLLKNTIKIIVGAVLETFIFQSILFYVISKNGNLLFPSKYIICSSLLFALAHITQCDGVLIIDFLQIICHFLAGIVYTSTYYIAKKKKKNAFVSVAFIHFLFNFCVIALVWLGTHD